MSSSRSLEERVVELETIVMHLERDVEQLNGVIVAQQAEIESLKKLVERLQSRFETALEEPEARDPREERPPHY